MNKTIAKILLYTILLLVLLLFLPGCPGQDEGDGEPTPEPTTEPSPAPATRPIADAGDDIVWFLVFPTFLDGTGSYDPNDDPLSYLWEFVSVPATSGLTNENINNADKAEASFTADVRGFYTCSLTVDDGNETDTDEVDVEIRNLPPNANAGENQVVGIGEEAFLDGSDSNTGFLDEGDTITFAWEFKSIPGGSSLTNSDITDPDTATPSLTPDVQGDFELLLTVGDGYDTDTDTVSVFALGTGFGVIEVTIE